MRTRMERRAFCHALACVVTCGMLLCFLPAELAAAEDDWRAVAIKRDQVTSSNLASVGYDPTSRVLEIEFHSGSVYRYRNVPASAFEALMRAKSKGRYFTQKIRGRYDFRRMENPRP